MRDKSFEEVGCSISVFNGKHIHYFMKDFQAHRLISPCNCNPSPSPSPPSSPHPLRPLCTSLTSAVAPAPQPAMEAAPNPSPRVSTPRERPPPAPSPSLAPLPGNRATATKCPMRKASSHPIRDSRRRSTGPELEVWWVCELLGE